MHGIMALAWATDDLLCSVHTFEFAQAYLPDALAVQARYAGVHDPLVWRESPKHLLRTEFDKDSRAEQRPQW